MRTWRGRRQREERVLSSSFGRRSLFYPSPKITDEHGFIKHVLPARCKRGAADRRHLRTISDLRISLSNEEGKTRTQTLQSSGGSLLWLQHERRPRNFWEGPPRCTDPIGFPRSPHATPPAALICFGASPCLISRLRDPSTTARGQDKRRGCLLMRREPLQEHGWGWGSFLRVQQKTGAQKQFIEYVK